MGIVRLSFSPAALCGMTSASSLRLARGHGDDALKSIRVLYFVTTETCDMVARGCVFSVLILEKYN